MDALGSSASSITQSRGRFRGCGVGSDVGGNEDELGTGGGGINLLALFAD